MAAVEEIYNINRGEKHKFRGQVIGICNVKKEALAKTPGGGAASELRAIMRHVPEFAADFAERTISNDAKKAKMDELR